jgi:hypothetical protein
MAYVGNIPATNYSTVSYQDLTGGTGTGFTLDYPAGSAQDIEVFVNNVRQEPGVAYTVAGTALTMTGSIVATDDFYVVFQGYATQTVTHPSTANLQAADADFSGTVQITGSFPIWENKQTVAADYTITDGYNAMSAGPITVDTGVTVTVNTGETWTVV